MSLLLLCVLNTLTQSELAEKVSLKINYILMLKTLDLTDTLLWIWLKLFAITDVRMILLLIHHFKKSAIGLIREILQLFTVFYTLWSYYYCGRIRRSWLNCA